MPWLQQVRGVIKALQTPIKALQTFTMVLLAKIVSSVNLETSAILAKRLILDISLDPGCASTY